MTLVDQIKDMQKFKIINKDLNKKQQQHFNEMLELQSLIHIKNAQI